MSEPETEYDRPRKMAQLGRRQYEGIGPVTNDGMPIILRSVNNRLPLASPSTSLSFSFNFVFILECCRRYRNHISMNGTSDSIRPYISRRMAVNVLPTVLELKHCTIWWATYPHSSSFRKFPWVVFCNASVLSVPAKVLIALISFWTFLRMSSSKKTTSITQLSPTHPIAFTKWIQTISWYATSVPEVILTILLLYTISS